MRLTKILLTVVFALLSAAGAQTLGPGDLSPRAAGRGAHSGAAFDRAAVAGSVSLRSLPIPTPTSCPVVDVYCSDESKPGGRLTFIANISGGDPNVTPTFKWKVSVGTISSGQGTSSITVDASKAAGRSVTATVEVGGYEPACAMFDSYTFPPGDPTRARKVDEYGNLGHSEEKSRLDVLAVELDNDQMSQGYLICYGGRRTEPGEARHRCEDAKSYLVSDHGADATRIVAVEGGRRDVPTVELWIVPFSAQRPQASPTVFPNKSSQPASTRGPERRPRR